MTITYELHRLRATAIFDLTDRYAQDRGVRGLHPRPIGSIKFLLTGRVMNDGSRQNFERPLELVVERNPSGYRLFFNTIKLPNGAEHQGFLSAGTYILRVESRFYQQYEAVIKLPKEEPDKPYLYELEPGFAYPFPTERALPKDSQSKLGIAQGPTLLRGSLHYTDGHGIAGAIVEVVEPVIDVGEGKKQEIKYKTDQSGQWVLAFPEEIFPQEATDDGEAVQDVKIRFKLPKAEAPDETVEHLITHRIVRGHEKRLAQTSLRGWVRTEAGLHIENVTIRVNGFPGHSTTGQDGSWFYYFELNQPGETVVRVDVTAELPDGTSQTRTNVPIKRGATAVVPTFRF